MELMSSTRQNLIIAVKALKEIRDTQGKVCDNFELCNHKACHSSYTSWAIADKALSELSFLE